MLHKITEYFYIDPDEIVLVLEENNNILIAMKNPEHNLSLESKSKNGTKFLSFIDKYIRLT
jgi:hypothetical protein